MKSTACLYSIGGIPYAFVDDLHPMAAGQRFSEMSSSRFPPLDLRLVEVEITDARDTIPAPASQEEIETQPSNPVPEAESAVE